MKADLFFPDCKSLYLHHRITNPMERDPPHINIRVCDPVKTNTSLYSAACFRVDGLYNRKSFSGLEILIFSTIGLQIRWNDVERIRWNGVERGGWNDRWNGLQIRWNDGPERTDGTRNGEAEGFVLSAASVKITENNSFKKTEMI